MKNKGKEKNKNLIIVLVAVIPLFIICIIGVILYLLRPIKVTSIKIIKAQPTIDYGQEYMIDYEVLPKNATNKNIKVKIKNGILKKVNNAKKLTFQTLDKMHGNEQICIISDENKKIKSCIDVYAKPKPFSKQMEERFYTNNGNGSYTIRTGEILYELNVKERYITALSEQNGTKLFYKYYYRSRYGEAHNSSDGFNIDWYYNEETNRATCAASSYYTMFCNYSSESAAINNFVLLKQLCQTLIKNYTDEELRT